MVRRVGHVVEVDDVGCAVAAGPGGEVQQGGDLGEELRVARGLDPALVRRERVPVWMDFHVKSEIESKQGQAGIGIVLAISLTNGQDEMIRVLQLTAPILALKARL